MILSQNLRKDFVSQIRHPCQIQFFIGVGRGMSTEVGRSDRRTGKCGLVSQRTKNLLD